MASVTSALSGSATPIWISGGIAPAMVAGFRLRLNDPGGLAADGLHAHHTKHEGVRNLSDELAVFGPLFSSLNAVGGGFVLPAGNLSVELLLLPPGLFIHKRLVVAGDQALEGPPRHDHDFLGLTAAVAYVAVLGIFAKFAVLLIRPTL